MIISELFESPGQCPECGGISFSDLILAEKKDACYHKIKATAKVWPSAYASGRLVQCRKKGAGNYGNKSEGVSEASSSGQRRGPLDLPPLEGPGGGGGGGGMSRDIATQRSVGGKEIPSLGKAGNVVTSPTADKVLTKVGGKDVSTTSGPTVTKTPNINSKIDPASDVPAYVRQGKPDPVTIPKPGTKPKILMRPGETMNQAVQRTKDEQEFGKFLKGQGEQTFGTQPAAQTSGSNQIPTIRLPNGQTIPDPARVSPSGQYERLDKIARNDEIAVDAMVKKARENAQARDASQAAKEKQLGLEPGSLRPRSQYEKERDSALRDEEKKLGLQPGSLSSRSQRQPEQTTTLPGEKENSGIFNYIKNNPKKSTVAAIGAVSAADELLKDKKLKEQSPKKQPPEVDYDDEYQAMVARVKKLAGLGPLKTMYDPNKRVYRNMPTAVQPPRQSKK